MKIYNLGVKEDSHIYFHAPSQVAKRLLYYPKVVGYFSCDENYNVERESYDSILALFVKEGKITLIQDGKTVTAEAGELLLIDCYKWHRYYCDDFAKTIWVHFDGGDSLAWYKEICQKQSQNIKIGANCIDCLIKIVDGVKGKESDFNLSLTLYDFLCRLMNANSEENTDVKRAWINDAIRYVKNNLEKNLTVEDVASTVHLSASYFSKVFKTVTGFSPYDYLVNQRLERAKEQLLKTNLPIAIVASKCGFNSENNFIYTFKKEVGVSPLKFRKTKY